MYNVRSLRAPRGRRGGSPVERVREAPQITNFQVEPELVTAARPLESGDSRRDTMLHYRRRGRFRRGGKRYTANRHERRVQRSDEERSRAADHLCEVVWMHGFIAARPRFLRRGAAPPLRTPSAFQQGCVFLAIRFGDQHTLSARRDFPEAQVDAEVRGAARAELTASDLPHDAVFSRGVGAEPVPVNLPHRGVARPPIEGGAV